MDTQAMAIVPYRDRCLITDGADHSWLSAKRPFPSDVQGDSNVAVNTSNQQLLPLRCLY